MDMYFQSLLVCAFTALLISVQLLFTGQILQRPLRLSYSSLTLSVFCWCLFEMIHAYNFRHFGWPQRAFIISSIMLLPTTAVFLWTYLGIQVRHRRISTLVALAFIVCVLSVCLVPGHFLVDVEDEIPPLNFALILALTLYAYTRSRQTHNYVYREHAKLLCLGVLLVALGFAANVAIAPFPWSLSVGHIVLAIQLYVVFYVIKSKQLLCWEALIVRMIHLSLMAGLLLFTYQLVLFWLGENPEWALFNTLVGSCILVVGFEPFNRLAHFLFQRIRSGRHRRDLELNANQLGTLDQVFQQVTKTVESLFPISSMAIYLMDSVNSSLLQVHSESRGSEIPPYPRNIPSHHLVDLPRLNVPEYVVDVRRLTVYIHLVDHRSDRHMFRRWIDFLNQIHSQIFIPLRVGEEILGCIVLRSPDTLRISRLMQRVLDDYFSEVARIIRHHQVFAKSSEHERLLDLGLMAAGLAHELKNPLGSIYGAAEILSSKFKSDPESLDFLQVIQKESKRMNGLIYQILQFSHVQERQSTMTPLDANHLLTECFRRVFHDRPDIQLKLDVLPKNQPIQGRPEIIDLAFSNLFQNIKDVSYEPGTVHVKYRLVRDHDQESWLQIDIQDEGPGMSQEILNRIFVPYVTTKSSGSGIGMSLVKKALDVHGAKIHVSSQLGFGTKYSLFFRVPNEVQGSVNYEDSRFVSHTHR